MIESSKYRNFSQKISKRFNPLRYGGGLIGPPFFQRPNSQKNLKYKKSEQISIPPLISLLFTLCFNFYQNHLVCLQNTFEKTCPESRSPKGSCHILCWFNIYILQNNITPGRLRFRPQHSGGGAWPQQSSENKSKLLKRMNLALSLLAFKRWRNFFEVVCVIISVENFYS